MQTMSTSCEVTSIPNNGYVHGYSAREQDRLVDQATTLTELLHYDTYYPAGSSVLEAGCGVGAQTVALAQYSPAAQITSIDLSPDSVAQARKLVESRKLVNVTVQQADIFHLPFAEAQFDHIFVCFVLEHLLNPAQALAHLRRVLKPGGSITVIEGDHGSAYFHPDSQAARQAIQCQVVIQAQLGGNSFIGRQIFPLLSQAGFRAVVVSPRMVYVDASRPEFVEGFTKNTFTAMIEGVQEQALASRLIAPEIWEQGIRDLYRTTEPDGTFCYTFFKGVARK
jgi:ubiquinone/menaquinone biosynthesis C-methylase UbiE